MTSKNDPTSRVLVYVLFFLSGATALVYEVVWGRQLTYVFGGSSLAVATVLAAFMAGLALGSFLLGRIADRTRRPFLLYGILEGAIGVWALLLPFLLRLADGLYRALSLAGMGPVPLTVARFLICFVMLLVPTTMMGGTLPVLLRYVAMSMGRIGWTAAILYAINTLGAVTGTTLAGFFLLPALGMFRATAVAAAFNLGILALAAIRGRAEAPVRADAPAEAPRDGAPAAPRTPDGLRRAAFAAYALSGLCALAYEVVWTRVLVMSLGTTTYAFTTMLASFLIGLAGGSLIASRFVDRLRRPAVAFALTQVGIAVAALAAIPALGQMPRIFLKIYPLWGDSWTLQIATKFGVAILIMLPVTLLSGMTFPIVTRLALTGLSDVGRRVGILYAWNTVGAISGSLLAGFILLPLLGRQHALLLIVALNAAGGAALLLYARPGRRLALRLLVPAAVALAALFVVAARPWNVQLLHSGVYVYAERYRSAGVLERFLRSATLLYEGEDSEAVVSVWAERGILSLRTNGKVEASTGEDMATQKLIAHMPLLTHENPKSALLIGLASGVTLGSMITHPLDEIVTVELLPSMTRASDLFRRENRNALDDPRVRLLIADGRNYLHLSPKTFDVIVSEPSNPWIAGLSNLFSREFFRLAASRLNPGGVLCQWVQIYDMRSENLQTVLRTFREVFPYVTLWWVAPTGDLILLGSESAGAVDPHRILERPWPEEVREDLEGLGITSPVGLLCNYIGAGPSIDRFTGGDGPRVTDDNLILEFAVPRNFYRKLPGYVLQDVYEIREPLVVNVPDSTGTERPLDVVAARYRALQIVLDRTTPMAQSAAQMEDHLRVNPEDPLARDKAAEMRNAVGSSFMLAGRTLEARAEFARAYAVGIPAERLVARSNLGYASFAVDDLDAAEADWRWGLERDPRNPDLHYNIGQILFRRGDMTGAEAAYREALRWEPNYADVLNALAWLLAAQGRNLDEAVSLARRAVKFDSAPNNLDTLGFALLGAGKTREARSVLESASQGAPTSPEILFHLALARSRDGDRTGAMDAARRSLQLDPRGANAAAVAGLLKSLETGANR